MIETSSRLLALLSLLQTRRDWPGGALAERLGVSTRTVRRDVDRLRVLGYRIDAVMGPDGGYRLAAGSDLPPLLLDDEQAVALAVALQNAPASGADIAEAAERALLTVRQVMPSRLRHRIDGVRFTGGSAAVRVDPAVLETVSEHVRLRRTLRFDYGLGQRDAPPRRSEPHGLVARDGFWYLVAWDVDRDDWRIFRLDRLTPRIPPGPSFAPRPVPTGDVGTYLSARFKGSTGADRWPCVGRVELDLPLREVAPWVGDGEAASLSERTTLVTLGSWSWTGLLASVLRFDAPFRIVAPEELVSAAGELARRLVASHPA
jgi:predicted DNA-binding transcriptional regulator YafY